MKIVDQFKHLEQLYDGLDSTVWNIFDRWVKISQMHFSKPERWHVDYNGIVITGYDGAFDCYDVTECTIPFKYFENPDLEFAILANEIQAHVDNKAMDKIESDYRNDCKRLRELQEKLGVV